MKLYKCLKCGTIYELLSNQNTLSCCGDIPIELKANSVDASSEKHLPYCIIDNNIVKVKVGELLHPMEEEHYIEWVCAEYSNKMIKIFFKPGEEPQAKFDYEPGMIITTYCNKHGLWSKKI